MTNPEFMVKLFSSLLSVHATVYCSPLVFL